MIEILIVLIILTAVFVIVLSSLSSFRDKQTLRANAIVIASLLNDARAATVASKEASQYGVHFETGRAAYFKGTTFSEPSSYNKEIKTDGAILISGIALQGGGVDVVFNQLTGETLQYGAITLTARANSALVKIITISQTGVITHE